jgi:hypothetical protein
MDIPGVGDGLDLWFQAWIQGFLLLFAEIGATVVMGAVVIAIFAFFSARTVRRWFWCAQAGRAVEVEFERRGPLRTLARVRSCSAFEDKTAIGCSRRCLDGNFRRQWEQALPVADGRPAR